MAMGDERLTPAPVIVDSALTIEEALAQNPESPTPPEVLERLRLLTVRYYTFKPPGLLNGPHPVHEGQIVVHEDLVDDVREAFDLIRVLRFPIGSVIPIVKFGFSDEASVMANNSSGFNNRVIAETNRPSIHAAGMAIDINPRINPYIRDDYRFPPDVDYDPTAIGAILGNGSLVSFFKERGWVWGGDWEDRKDYHHFEKPLALETP